jgi:hypothetical protein
VTTDNEMRRNRHNLLLSLGILVMLAGALNGYGQEPFDRYRTFISWTSERANLDNFVIALRRNPETIGYIAFYTGNDHSYDKTRSRIDRARNYLIKTRGIDSSRIKILYAGELGRFATTVLQPVDKALPPPYKSVDKPR